MERLGGEEVGGVIGHRGAGRDLQPKSLPSRDSPRQPVWTQRDPPVLAMPDTVSHGFSDGRRVVDTRAPSSSPAT
ncbi:hypothetical protein I553_3554 [Mycobacterium xenopi 4042]|uniref:Uncharacterized protein n=1 Tax=Mycobacterium xenopi 4042 TaxID=1299334 RepID=X8AP04_MYCXE|nr:hypothetical protein I553_3554 [Mycobacterium xenopi 4042]